MTSARFWYRLCALPWDSDASAGRYLPGLVSGFLWRLRECRAQNCRCAGAIYFYLPSVLLSHFSC